MRILLTNDDGIDAPGLAALEASLPSGTDYIVIAPDRQRSECSHSVTTGNDLRIVRLGENRWSLSGTPVDCVRVGVSMLGPELGGVLSGVNDGGNLGADIYISGTVAAAREAALHGIPAVAISQYRKPSNPRTWNHVPVWLENRILPLLSENESNEFEQSFWNINLPSLSDGTPNWVKTHLDRHPLPTNYDQRGELLTYRTNYHGRTKLPGTDVTVCFEGQISVSRVRF